MLQTLEELRKVELQTGQIVNGIDSPFLMSVDSTTPLQTEVDEVSNEEKEEEGKKDSSLQKDAVRPKEEKDADFVRDVDAVQKRINDLTRKWRSTERERDFERSQRIKETAELQEELKKFQSNVSGVGKPQRDSFEDIDEYYEALTDWKMEQKFKTLQDTKALEEVKKVAETAKSVYDELLIQGAEKYEDFEKYALDKDLVITPAILDAVLLVSNGADVLYYLGKNVEESAAIAKMSSLKVAIEIGKLEEKLLKEGKSSDKPASSLKRITNAPAPIIPVKTTGVTEKDPSNMSAKEYRAWRERKKE